MKRSRLFGQKSRSMERAFLLLISMQAKAKLLVKENFGVQNPNESQSLRQLLKRRKEPLPQTHIKSRDLNPQQNFLCKRVIESALLMMFNVIQNKFLVITKSRTIWPMSSLTSISSQSWRKPWWTSTSKQTPHRLIATMSQKQTIWPLIQAESVQSQSLRTLIECKTLNSSERNGFQESENTILPQPIES